MDACLAAGVHYIDTANYEPHEEAKFEYKWQWAYHDSFKEAGLTALLGSGFDPGVTNVFCAYAQKHLFDEIDTIDILDANAGDTATTLRPTSTQRSTSVRLPKMDATGKRRMERSRTHEHTPGLRLPNRRAARCLSPLSRGDGIALSEHQRPETHSFLDDLF